MRGQMRPSSLFIRTCSKALNERRRCSFCAEAAAWSDMRPRFEANASEMPRPPTIGGCGVTGVAGGGCCEVMSRSLPPPNGSVVGAAAAIGAAASGAGAFIDMPAKTGSRLWAAGAAAGAVAGAPNGSAAGAAVVAAAGAAVGAAKGSGTGAPVDAGGAAKGSPPGAAPKASAALELELGCVVV